MDRDNRAIRGEDFDRIHANAQKVMEQATSVILGKDESVRLLVTAFLSAGHVLIEDVPGVGKTTLASTLAKAVGIKYKRAQFTPDVMPSDITGFTTYNKNTGEFEYREGLAICNILLADEINRASPKTQSSLLEVMEEGTVTVDGKTYPVGSPFMVIATQNPVGFVGTHPLPEAQLDRFILKLSIGYPKTEDEISIINTRRLDNPLAHVKTVVTGADVTEAQDAVRKVHIDDTIYKYIVELAARTRIHPLIALGASPRASLALMRLSQAYAFLEKRDYVIPEDVAQMYVHAIGHRVILKQEAKLKRISVEEILGEIKRTVPVKLVK